MLLTVLGLISQSSNFARTTILRNELSRLFCDAVKLFLCHKNMCNNVMIINNNNNNNLLFVRRKIAFKYDLGIA